MTPTGLDDAADRDAQPRPVAPGTPPETGAAGAAGGKEAGGKEAGADRARGENADAGAVADDGGADRPDPPRAGDGTPAQPRAPRRIGPYQVVGRLGSGAMGRVYLGRSPAGRLVAVKTIRPELAQESDFRTRFAREVAAARRVSGVFTAAVVAADPDADVPWLATAYVPAPSLDELVRRCGPLPVTAVRWLAAGCAEALESIHEAGLVHRDLKPSNVLVSPDGPRVIDFGVARAVERTQLTLAKGSLGTPAYMAPEQARDTRRATAASDVFSLGSTLVFAATGHAPYHGETVTDLLVQLATQRPDLSGLPPELIDMVGGCLERDPGDRPTPAELVAQMAPFVDSEVGHEPGRSTLPVPALAFIERHRQDPLSQGGTSGARHPQDTIGSYAGVVLADPDRYGAGPADAFASQPGIPAGPADRDDRPAGGGPPAGDRPAASAPSGGPRDAARSVTGSAAWRLRVAAVVVAVGVVTALVVVGYLLGTQHSSGGNPTAAQNAGGVGGPPPRGDPPGPPPPDHDRSGGPPRIEVNQPAGDGDTIFVVYGRDLRPGTKLTVRLVGGPVSRVTPVVDEAGSFNYAVNQTHEFFPGRMPAGVHRVRVSTPDGRAYETTFSVHP